MAFDSSGGFLLPDTSIVAPDAAVLARAHWDALPADVCDSFIPLAPAIAIEIRSKSDRAGDLRAKLLHLREAGTQYVALVDPFCAEVWTDGEPPAGFTLDLTQLLD